MLHQDDLERINPDKPFDEMDQPERDVVENTPADKLLGNLETEETIFQRHVPELLDNPLTTIADLTTEYDKLEEYKDVPELQSLREELKREIERRNQSN